MNDVASLLASYDAKIEAARNRRQGLSGSRPWKQPPAKPGPIAVNFGDATSGLPRANQLSPIERKTLNVLLSGTPFTTRMIATHAGLAVSTAGHAIATLKRIFNYRRIRYTDLRHAGGSIAIHDLEAARRLLL